MGQRVLFHACCAPCASAGLPALLNDGYLVSLFFYGGNIHPEEEWNKRLEALERLSFAYSVQLRARPYDTNEWADAVKGLEQEPEGGKRCAVCMKLQIEKAAQFAVAEAIPTLCTSLTLSPQKSPRLINQWGTEIAQKYGLEWLERIWRKNNGVLKSVQESRRLSLYRQKYCGCRFSIRDSSSLAEA